MDDDIEVVQYAINPFSFEEIFMWNNPYLNFNNALSQTSLLFASDLRGQENNMPWKIK